MHQLGRYTLMRRVGVGGMAEIWKAKVQGPAGFEKTVAIKRILPHLVEDDEFIEMFVEEAKLVARLVHPNIVQVFDFGMTQADEEQQKGYFIAMEYVSGQNLATIQKKLRDTDQRMPFEVALYVGAEAAKGLAYAHAGHSVVDAHGRPQQIVHRDVSPHNVLISYLGEVKVTDFGIAKVTNAITKTSGGILKGKVAYMSPEQATMKPLDGRSDIFCLGIVLYHLVTGKPLFDGKRTEEVYAKITNYEGIKPEQMLGVPHQVAEILETALQADPDARYQHATALEVALTQVLGPGGVVEARRALGALVQRLFPKEYRREKQASAEPPENATLVVQREEVSGAVPVDQTSLSNPKLAGKTSVSDSFSVSRRVPTTSQKVPPEDLNLPAEKRRSFSGLMLALAAVVIVLGGLGYAGKVILDRIDLPTPSPGATTTSFSNAETPVETSMATSTPVRTAVAVATVRHTPTPRPVRTRTPAVMSTPAPTPRPSGTGWVTVNARPWVRVVVDGKTVARETPLRRYKLRSGTYQMIFINPHEKFREARSVTIRRGETTDVFVDVKKKSVRVTQNSR